MAILFDSDFELGDLTPWEATSNVTATDSTSHTGIYSAAYDISGVVSYLQYNTDIPKPATSGVRFRWMEYVPSSLNPPTTGHPAGLKIKTDAPGNYLLKFAGFDDAGDYKLKTHGFRDDGSWNFIGGDVIVPRDQWFRMEVYITWSSADGVADGEIGWSIDGVEKAWNDTREIWDATTFEYIYFEAGIIPQGDGSFYIDEFIMTDDPATEIGDPPIPPVPPDAFNFHTNVWAVGSIDAASGLRYQSQDTDERYALSGAGGGSVSGTHSLTDPAVHTDVLGSWTSGQLIIFDGTNYVPLTSGFFVGRDELLQQYALQLDEAAGSLTYVGEALPGTATASGSWRIKRLDESGDPEVIITWADGDDSFDNIWNNRAALSYT